MIHATIIGLFATTSLAFGGENNAQADYGKSLNLAISYNQRESGGFTVTLKNISETSLSLVLNTAEIEGEFCVGTDRNLSFYDKHYLHRLMSSVWFPGRCELKPQAEVEWKVELGELVHANPPRTSVTKESLAGKSIYLRLDRLAVFPAPGQSNVYIKSQSNAIILQAESDPAKN